MDVYQEIKQKLCQLTGADIDRGLFTAEVTKVSGDTCSVRYGDLVFEDVRLRVIAEDSNNSRMLLTPKVGSCVLVADLSGGDKRDFAVVMLSEVQKVELTADEVKLNGGSNGGLVKIEELTKQLNGLKDVVNDLISKYNKHTHSVATPDTFNGTAAPTTDTESQTAAQFDQSKYEDTTIKH